ncbi:hypothetical protein PM082_003498 [Marasmius tenuissimus]|nr:hypothetical protein PM082_003498 [Marasmius tenuissimus]
MKSLALATVAALFAVAEAVVTINTPNNLVQCQPTLITWSGGPGPFTLSYDGNNPTGPALETFPGLQGTSFTWDVDIPAGRSVGFLLRDSTGATSQTAAVTIQKGSEFRCSLSPRLDDTIR